MKNFSTQKERIIQFIDYKGISKNKFYIETGISNGVLDKKSGLSMDTIEKFYSTYPEINPEWLLTGKGEMLKEDNRSLPVALPAGEQTGIPLIPIEAMGGIASGEVSVLELECERYVVPMFKGADFLIPVKGSSMVPKYNSGDVVACKRVPMQDIFFQWNKVYVLDTNQGAIIKRVAKSETPESIKIVSENSKYEPFDLHLSQIYSISIVLGVIRLE